jgi:hypothetical protein
MRTHDKSEEERNQAGERGVENGGTKVGESKSEGVKE